MNKFWNWVVEEENSESRELHLEGTIASESWFDDDVTPALFRSELLSAHGPITVYVNSPGGDCVAASQIYTMLVEYPGDVTVKVDGMAASAASVIAMAGTTVLMAPTAVMMIHNPLTCAFGNRDDMKQAIEMLDEVKESIINAYEIKTGLPRKKIGCLMDKETWMNANKAVELGFADGIIGMENAEVEENSGWAMNSVSSVRMLAVNSLMDKMMARTPKDEVATEDLVESNDTRDAQTEIEPVADNRVSIDSLYNRLNKIKYH